MMPGMPGLVMRWRGQASIGFALAPIGPARLSAQIGAMTGSAVFRINRCALGNQCIVAGPQSRSSFAICCHQPQEAAQDQKREQRQEDEKGTKHSRPGAQSRGTRRSRYSFQREEGQQAFPGLKSIAEKLMRSIHAQTRRAKSIATPVAMRRLLSQSGSAAGIEIATMAIDIEISVRWPQPVTAIADDPGATASRQAGAGRARGPFRAGRASGLWQPAGLGRQERRPDPRSPPG